MVEGLQLGVGPGCWICVCRMRTSGGREVVSSQDGKPSSSYHAMCQGHASARAPLEVKRQHLILAILLYVDMYEFLFM
jgi:hypothetical protein